MTIDDDSDRRTSAAGSPAATVVAWSDLFGAHDGVAGAAFLPPQPHLPNEAWDRGERVTALRDILATAASGLPHVSVVDGLPAATVADVELFHTTGYVAEQGLAGTVAPGSRAAAALAAAGAARELCRQVWRRQITNGYALVRPAGHHAEPAVPGGGCLVATGVLAALEARRLGARRVLMLDWDAHHGNSQQGAFWSDPAVLTISIHQDRRYPHGTGGVDARGAGDGYGATINVPVPMGSGGGVYRAVLDEVVVPAADRYRPDMVIVASGLDGNYLDPSARLALHSGDYATLAATAVDIAARHAGGRLLLTHEGGYALPYLPLCFLRIVEALSGEDAGIEDPFLRRWGTDFAADVPEQARATIETCARLAAEVPAG